MSRLAGLRHAAVAAAWIAFAAGPAVAMAQDRQPIPPLASRVTDLTGSLTSAERTSLESQLADFEARKGAQIAVLIVSTTQPEEIEQYSIRVVDAWKLGREEPDDGALLLVAMEDRALRIEVGRGLEGALTDLVANRIIDETITPRFREGDFAGGIAAGVDRMIAVVDGEPLPEPEQHWDGHQGLGGILPILFFVVFVASTILRAIFGRALGSSRPAASRAASRGSSRRRSGSPSASAYSGSCCRSCSVSATADAGRAGPGMAAGRRGWGGGRSSGGGGFGGGGGSFGGGGASGRW